MAIYVNFPGGKDELVAEATRVAGRHIARGLDAVADSDVPVDEVLRGFGATWRENLIQSDFRSSCPVGAGALAGQAAPSAPAHAGQAFSDWAAAISRALSRAGVPTETAKSLGVVAVCAVEGALLMCISTRSTDPIDVVTDHLIEVAQQHVPRPSSHP